MKCFVYLSAITLLLLAAKPSAALASGSKTAADAAEADKKLHEVLVSYTAPLHHVVLTKDLHLTDTEEVAEYDNPVSATPSGTVTVKKTAQISKEQAAELLLFIRENGFHQLKDEYGAGSQERNYPYTILVRDGKREKQVIYRSNPAAAARPEAFSQTEKKIIEFASKAVQLKTGE
ncbi:hypothetical protein VU08_03755 [Desulfobulbus sp. F5]|nr:hypothetical protein [Desulfobulbus sp. F5]